MHQIHKGAGGERCVKTIHHGDQIPLGGTQSHRGPAQQARQGVVFRRDRKGKFFDQQIFRTADGPQGPAAGFQIGIPVLVCRRFSQALELVADPIKQLFDVGALIGFKAIQNRRSLGAK